MGSCITNTEIVTINGKKYRGNSFGTAAATFAIEGNYNVVLSGMVYIMTIAGGVWNHEGLAGEGWLAVALVIFCLWMPRRAMWGSALFGALMIMYLRVHLPIPNEIYKILPYIVTIAVLIFTSVRKKHSVKEPESLGLSYFREER